MLALLM